MLFCITAVINRDTDNGSSVMVQVPTFFLNSDIQGITSCESAETVATRMLKDINPDASVFVCALEV